MVSHLPELLQSFFPQCVQNAIIYNQWCSTHGLLLFTRINFVLYQWTYVDLREILVSLYIDFMWTGSSKRNCFFTNFSWNSLLCCPLSPCFSRKNLLWVIAPQRWHWTGSIRSFYAFACRPPSIEVTNLWSRIVSKGLWAAFSARLPTFFYHLLFIFTHLAASYEMEHFGTWIKPIIIKVEFLRQLRRVT